MFAALRYKVEGWKVIIANAMVGLPSALYAVYLEFGTVDFTPVVPQKYVAWFLIGNAVLGVILRIWTTGAIGCKTPRAGD